MKRWFASLALSAGCMAGMAMADPVRVQSETASPDLIEKIQAELASETAPDTLFEARRQARRAARRSRDYLNSLGYFAPEISYAVEPGPPPQAYVQIDPGPRFTLDSVIVDTGTEPLSEPAQQALDRVLTLEVGAPAIPETIVSQEAGLIAALKSTGHAEAEAGERIALGDKAAGTIDLTYQLQPGPRIRLGKVVYPDATRTRTDYLNRLIPFESGEFYTPKALSTYNRRLNATRLYSLASAQISETSSRITEDGSEVRDVVLTLEERPRYTFTAGTSFSTAEGPGLTTSLTRRDATRRGDTLTGSLTLANLERAIAADWRIPNIFAYDRTLVVSAKAGREETDAFDRDAATLRTNLEVRHSETLTYSVGLGSEFTREEDAFEQRDQQILSASAGARLDHANDPLDPTSGWRADMRAEPGAVIGDRSAQFFKLNGQISAYHGLDEADHFVVAGRVNSGFVFGASLADLPVSRRFFAGGGGSARGFEYQSVGPKDAENRPTGGRGLFEFSGELRWRRDRPLGFVAFIDGASVSADQGINFGDLKYSAGLGVRYDTIIGPIRFDIAAPIDPAPGDDPVQLYVSIGQAF